MVRLTEATICPRTRTSCLPQKLAKTLALALPASGVLGSKP